MRRSQFFMPRRAEVSARHTSLNAAYFERMGYAAPIGAGIYTHLPGAYRIFHNVRETLRKNLHKVGGCDVHFPAIQPTQLWKDMGRFELFGDTIFTFTDQHQREICLAPTHEVLAAYTAKQFIQSYRDLPVRISQIQSKFRDEIRPRGGVIRTREFTMQDLYSFDTGPRDAEISYAAVKQAYIDTLTTLRIPFRVKFQTDTGSIGGDQSHEFHVPAATGEDTLLDERTGEELRSLEIAHIFMLGHKYSEPAGATYVDRDGSKKFIYMCSYGFGIERTAAAYIEATWDGTSDLWWSWALAPFKVMVLTSNTPSWELYEECEAAGLEPLIEDREGLDFRQALREGFSMGLPIYAILGRSFEREEKVELRAPLLGETQFVSLEDCRSAIEQLRRDIEAVELIRMSFDIRHVDVSNGLVFATLRRDSDLEHLFCQRAEVPGDLLGNFGKKGSSVSSRGLKAGRFWVRLIREGQEGAGIEDYQGIPVFACKRSEDHQIEEIGEAFQQLWERDRVVLG